MGSISSSYHASNASAAKIIGALTILIGMLVLDSMGLISGVLFVAAGCILLFGAGRSIQTGLNPKNLLLVGSYFVLTFFAVGFGVV